MTNESYTSLKSNLNAPSSDGLHEIFVPLLASKPWIRFISVVGFIMTFGAIMILGMMGMPRRYYDWSNLQNADLG